MIHQRIVVEKDYLSLLDPPSCKQSLPLARRLPDDVGRTGRFVDFPVLDLALLTTIGGLLTDTLQLLLWTDIAVITRSHL